MMQYDWKINGSKFSLPSIPLTLEEGFQNGFPSSLPASLAWRVRLGEVVDIAVVNPTMMAHPLHLHGHSFFVLGIGAGRKPHIVPSVSIPKNMHTSNGFVTKDSLPVAAHGWVLLRVQFNNPGKLMTRTPLLASPTTAYIGAASAPHRC